MPLTCTFLGDSDERSAPNVERTLFEQLGGVRESCAPLSTMNSVSEGNIAPSQDHSRTHHSSKNKLCTLSCGQYVSGGMRTRLCSVPVFDLRGTSNRVSIDFHHLGGHGIDWGVSQNRRAKYELPKLTSTSPMGTSKPKYKHSQTAVSASRTADVSGQSLLTTTVRTLLATAFVIELDT